jgi:hypothetical protein
MIAIQHHVISTNNYNKQILKELLISAENAKETIQHIACACYALAQSDYTHHHIQVANTVHQELAIKCGLPKEPLMQFYKYEP